MSKGIFIHIRFVAEIYATEIGLFPENWAISAASPNQINETVAENSATKRVDYWVLTILLSMGRGPVIVLGGKERPLVNVFMSRRNMKMQILKKSWRIV